MHYSVGLDYNYSKYFIYLWMFYVSISIYIRILGTISVCVLTQGEAHR